MNDIDSKSHGLWAVTAPPFVTTPLVGETCSDVAIVGAGYAGLSAALHLRALGLSVTVVEAVDVGFGGAGRNVGLVNAGLWLPPDEVDSVLGRPFGERLVAELGNAPQLVFELCDRYAMDCDARRNGTLHCAVGRTGMTDLEARAGQWLRRGAPVEMLDARRTASMTGSDAFAGALLDRRAGTIQPLAYVRGLAKAATQLGAAVHSTSPVERIERTGNKWKAATRSGSVLANWIVLATDVYATGAWDAIAREQVALPYFNVATRPLLSDELQTVLPGRHGAWDTQRVLTSCRLDRDGRLVFGSIGALRGTAASVHLAFARRALRTLFPQLRNPEFEHAWYGTIGMTFDNVPRFHKFAPNVIGFSGYNGRGIAPATAFGRVLARYVAGLVRDDELPLPVTEIEEPRFRQLRGIAYERGAQLAHLFASR